MKRKLKTKINDNLKSVLRKKEVCGGKHVWKKLRFKLGVKERGSYRG